MNLLSLKNKLKNHISPEQGKQLRLLKIKFRKIENILFSFLCRNSLTNLAVLYGTDKWGLHWYAKHYEHHFRKLRSKKLKVLEIGIGGYDDPKAGGDSLRMWRTYFRNSQIYGIDIYDKSFHNEARIKTFQGSQVDVEFLEKTVNIIGDIDIVIDDGSHINEHIIETFKFLFPKLKSNGLYVIEDLQTSYWEDYGGSSDIQNMSQTTAMNFLFSLVHGLNYREIPKENNQPSYFDLHISEICFYHNMVFIYKQG